jgi:phosphatidylinositol alpha-1,6-mannosyltransferase
VAFSDYEEFLRDPPQPLPPEPTALFAGVLERYKAVDVLLDAWPEVVRVLPRAKLTIVGGGKQESTLRARIQHAGLAESVTMIRPVPRAELRRMLDNASCLVLPSRSEGLARIVIEAMARGRPVVASRVGGIEELVDDGVNGRLVGAEDAPALAKALLDVLEDPARAERMGEESRRRASARDPLGEYEAGIARMASWIGTP